MLDGSMKHNISNYCKNMNCPIEKKTLQQKVEQEELHNKFLIEFTKKICF